MRVRSADVRMVFRVNLSTVGSPPSILRVPISFTNTASFESGGHFSKCEDRLLEAGRYNTLDPYSNRLLSK